jgi:hypothetical protein
MGEGYAVGGEGCAACNRGVGTRQKTHSAGSVNIQSIIFKYVVAIEPYSTPDNQNRFAIH